MQKEEKPLYEDSDIKIEHHPRSHEDHLLYLKRNGEVNYIIQRGILETIATTPRNEVEPIMRRVNELMLEDAIQRGLTIDSLGYAIAQAYIEDEKRLNSY